MDHLIIYFVFFSGDTRTNQMASLVIIHTLFMREHNRIADELHHLNPQWNDEHIFLETRRILAAILQVITYNEFLPALLGILSELTIDFSAKRFFQGEEAMEEFDLSLEIGDTYSYDYDQRIDPSIFNEFASAAFRFGHSMVDGMLKYVYNIAKSSLLLTVRHFQNIWIK